MQRSKLDGQYSLSSKLTCKEMTDKISNYRQISLQNHLEFAKYVDPYTGKVKSDLCIIREKCPLCDSKDFTFLFTKHGFDHMLCNSCELIFTLQILDGKKTKYLEIGNEGKNYGILKADPIINENDRKKFQIVFEKIRKYGDINHIFDFGSASGTFLDWAKENNYDIIGHEYHDALRKFCQKKGHTVLNDKLETIQFDREFDLITCWDYLDHVINPKEIVANLGKCLKQGGLFFYAINNRDSLSSRIMHKDSNLFIGPHHTMHYGINQLKLLMKDFEFLDAESYVSELNWASNWLNFKNIEFGDTPLMTELFDPAKICELGMGFKVNAIFRKP